MANLKERQETREPESEASRLYKELSAIPVYKTARFPQRDVIQTSLAVRDHVGDSQRRVTKTIFVNNASNSTSTSLSYDPSDVVASLASPSGARLALLRETKGDQVTKRYVEIWKGDMLEASKDVTSDHDSFITDGFLTSLAFSPSETTLLYSAEANHKPHNDTETFRYVPNFGELLTTTKRVTLFLFNWTNQETGEDTLAKISAPSLTKCSFDQPGVYFTQAIFVDEEHIYATGYELTDDGRLLGLVWCQNRPASIWELYVRKAETTSPDNSEERFKFSACKLTSADRSCRSPRVLLSSDGNATHVFWLSNEVGGAHASCVSLHKLDLLTGKETALVDTVWEPQSENGFPGIYTFWIPQHPFVLDAQDPGHIYIVLDTIWRSRSTILLISIDNGSVREVTPDTDGSLYSWNVLGTDNQNQIISVRSSPTVVSQLMLGRFNPQQTAVDWKVIDQPTKPPRVEKVLRGLKASVIPIPDRDSVETVLLQNAFNDHGSKAAVLPCITYPHGGPHSPNTTHFDAGKAAYALLGYTISSPSYTGTPGFGEKYIRELLGKCGTLDVQDCIASVNRLIELGISKEGKGQQFVQGGSHGGFLAAHLIGQYPDVFSAAVIRNPVISAGELSTTDIPDWYFFEFGLKFDSKSIVSPDIYKSMFLASPIAHVDAVKAPVLLCIGNDDQRVAPTQGKSYYHALKGRGKEVDMLWFPGESHPLDGVKASRTVWNAGYDWFQKYGDRDV